MPSSLQTKNKVFELLYVVKKKKMVNVRFVRWFAYSSVWAVESSLLKLSFPQQNVSFSFMALFKFTLSQFSIDK